MDVLTDAERRGARVLLVLLVLGTLTDLYCGRHPAWAPAPAAQAMGDSAVAGAEPAPSPAPVPAASGPPRLDLNRADARSLDSLPGIGPVLAARIVEHRRRHGEFRAIDELLSVPGIGPRLLERMRPRLLDPAR